MFNYGVSNLIEDSQNFLSQILNIFVTISFKMSSSLKNF
jgi:hypothetical protein